MSHEQLISTLKIDNMVVLRSSGDNRQVSISADEYFVSVIFFLEHTSPRLNMYVPGHIVAMYVCKIILCLS